MSSSSGISCNPLNRILCRVMEKHTVDESREMLARCSAPPVALPYRKHPGRGLSNTLMWNRASVCLYISTSKATIDSIAHSWHSVGLGDNVSTYTILICADQGVSDHTLRMYHDYAANTDACTPERTRPAPKRRRGESSGDWLAVCLGPLDCALANLWWPCLSLSHV